MTDRKTIGILETGRPPEALQGEHGRYTDMFENLLKPLAEDLDFRVYVLSDDHFPEKPDECGGWIVTGSPHGVYEELPWMLKTEEFLREVVKSRIPLIGVCFGHQILAKAMGGRVEKSDKGWGLGYLDYEVTQAAFWMRPALDRITISATHQDQVVVLPPSAKIMARSDFCPYAVLAYGDSAISFQAHPEMTGAFLSDLIVHRDLPGDISSEPLDSIKTKRSHAPDIAQWMINFLRQSHVSQ